MGKSTFLDEVVFLLENETILSQKSLHIWCFRMFVIVVVVLRKGRIVKMLTL